MNYIYADHAATTCMSRAALEAMTEGLQRVYGNPSSIHAEGAKAAKELQKAREIIAHCLGAEASEIYFTGSGSESDNQALLSAAAAGVSAGKKHLISTAIEHHAVLHTLEKLKKQGFEVTLLPVGSEGLVCMEDLRRAVRPDTALVSVMTANNEIGTLQPVREIGAFCQEKKILFHTDAVQAAGHIRLSVNEMKADFLSLSAHKFHGPKGVGVLYAGKGVPLVSLIEGGGQEGGKRAGTENVPGIMGTAAAFKEACAHLEEKGRYTERLRNRLISGLSEIPYSALNGDRKRRLPGNISFVFDGVEGEALVLFLDSRGIAASSGSACTAGSLEPSHVIKALGYSDEAARSALRLSIDESNTEEEIDFIIKTVKEAVARLRTLSSCKNS